MLENLIRSARRRFILNEALAQSALGAAIVLGGFALLLIVGTALLGMWSLAVFAAVGIGLAVYRLRQRTPDEYSTAVRVDRSQELRDALSTAVYFSHQPAKAGAYRDAQFSQAEEAAGRVAVASAVPFTFPRAAYALAALALLSTGLTGLRYRSGHLDLRAPLTSLFSEDTQATAKKKAAGGDKAEQWLQEAQNLLSKLGNGSDPNQPLPGDADQTQNAMNQALKDQQQKSLAATDQKGADGKTNGGKQGADGDQNANSDPLEGSGADPLNKNQSETQADAKNDKASGIKVNGKATNSKNGESMLSQLKEALSSMLSQSKQDASQQQEINNEQQDGQNDSMNADKLNASRSESTKDSSSTSAQDNDPNAQQSRSSDNAQGKLDSKNATKPGDAGSGIGTQDGNKEIKQAELLKAMGKITELIGKRANEVSGETTVEVQSGSQQLKTAYSNTQASHGETDGDVTRDEIPVSLQAYVQQYFAQVRKSADSKAKPADPSQTKK